MSSIRYFIEKGKSLSATIQRRDDIFIALIIILVGLGSFGLGRLSAQEGDVTEAIIVENIGASSSQAVVEGTIILSDQKYVGSRNGGKYHAPWCSGAKRIKEENQVWFASKAEAEQAGYTPAGNCKGL